MNKILFTLSILLATTFAQSQNLDSLYAVWKDETRADSSRAKAYYGYILNGFLFSDPDTASILADELIAFGKDRAYLEAQALGLYAKGASYGLRGDFPKALDYGTKNLKIKEQLGDQKGIAETLNGIGTIYRLQGNYPKALDYYTQSLKIKEQLGDQNGVANTLHDIGDIFNDQGNYPRALDYYTQSLKIKEQLGDQNGMANTVNNIGNIYSSQGDYPKALDYYTQSLKIKEQLGDRRGVANTLNNIGVIYKSQGDYLKALDYYTQSLKIKEQLGDRRGVAITLNNIGVIHKSQGDYPKALDYYTQSLKISEQMGDQNGVANALLHIGVIYKSQGDYPKALDYYTQSLKIVEQLGDQRGLADVLNNIGTLYQTEGDHRNALNYCQRAYDLALSISVLDIQKAACQCLYDSYKAMGKGNEALVYMEKMRVVEDSLKSKETTKQLQQMEFQQTMLQDSIANAEEARLVEVAHQEEVRQGEKTRNIALGGGLILLILAGGLYGRVRYIRKSKAVLQSEKDRSENLLLNILPAEIAEELKLKGSADARDFDQVSILFTDFKEFTQMSEKLSAKELVAEINHCFKAFDSICEKYGVEKIKTIGDSYMAAGGLPVPTEDSVKNTVLATLEMQAFISKRKAELEALNKLAFEMRVGIHTGPVVAGIVGVKKFQYDIWGDTVNTASRMESNGKVDQVNISQSTYEVLKNDPDFIFESRGKIQAKGKGEVEMYFVSKA